jgi:signal transduction histidine kinase
MTMKLNLVPAEGRRRRDQSATSERADELLRLVIEVSGIGVFETDLRRRQTRLSAELCVLLGLPVGSELSYDEMMRTIDERDRAALIASAEAAANSPDKGKWSGVCRVRRADGAPRRFCIHGRRFYRHTPKGLEPVRSLGVVVDITHLKETEDALRESEARLRFALEAAQMGTFDVDMAGSRAVIDAQEAKLLGLPPDTRIVAADELRKRVPFEKERLTQHREAYHHEFRLRMPDGSERWLSAHADVRANRIFGVNYDITDRRLAEVELQDSKARLQMATNAAALGVFEWDPETDSTIWENERMYEIFARAKADGPLNKRQLIIDYLHPDDERDFDAALEKALQNHSDFHVTCRIRRQDEAERWLQIDGTSRATADIHSPRLVGVVADITERRMLEQRAKDLAASLVTIQEDERRRISQELHDSTAQHLVAAKINLLSLNPKGGRRSPQRRKWQETQNSLREAMRELRVFSYLMHPPFLESHGVCKAIRQFVTGFADRSGLRVKLALNGKVDQLPFEMQRTLLRIAQEALANVHRHATASRVTLSLRWMAGCVHLVIVDDGRSGRASSGPGRGIRGMVARTHQYGGDLRVRSGVTGTTVHAVLPINLA